PAAGQQAPATGDPAPTRVRQGGGSVAEVAESVLPSVARVDVNGSAGSGSGSAVVYSEDGYLITNNHVVEGSTNVTVTLPDTQVVDAEVVGTDATSDLAVLEITPTRLTPPQFAAQQPRPGDTAIAIGSPFGLDSTVTSGIVSATERDVNAPGVTLVGLLQTDAAINPGNSGGALVNDRGELIGINTAILSQTGQSGGIGFAIPVSTVRDVADQLINQGEVRYAYLGVSTQDLNQGVASQLGLDSAEGALVAEVEPGSAADDAGLQPGDVIIALGDQEVTSSGDLVSAVRSFSPDDRGTLTLIRDGEEQEVEFAFGTLPSQG
ncbi:MAG: PDZ domain-containing protein, partial [Nitriliruptorales bacterium]|nr:PDZ domain-containing protein [Nitriliruptorales bacterium]